METTVFRLREEDLQSATGKEMIGKAGEILRAGGLVAFPTETVYGLGGDALNAQSSQKIYAAKGRPSDNPLIVHIYRMEDLAPIVREIPQKAEALAKAFWPGPLTMIFEKSERVPLTTTGGLTTVAVRMPSDAIAAAMIKAAGGYVAAPSANTSGRPSPTVAKYVEEDLSGKIEMILDGGQVCIGLESTIVDLTVDPPMILRPGAITKEMLSEVVGEVSVDQTILRSDSGQAPKAPGMKYRHYAPKGDLTIIEGDRGKVCARIEALSKEAMERGLKVGIIGTDETVGNYHATSVKSAGNRADESTIAKELYRILREFDDEGMDVMYSESFDDGGIGAAIMNRLLKAAGHHIERL
ncbi:MAG: threonylcarbamoyl-AMP synthase [Lachnospiraceae bacterium]|nr:threonylcarbamoyl-AMP synthase [Lachnospiraceae bacterium]